MELVAWLRDLSGREGPLFDAVRDALRPSLRESPEAAFGILLMPGPSADGLNAAHALSAEARTILVTGPDTRLSPDAKWSLLAAGVCDVLDWLGAQRIAEEVTSRITRWSEVEDAINNDRACAAVVGRSPTWQRILRQIVEIAIFSETDLLLTGETGTGKEQVARLVHDLDRRPRKGDLVVVDCSTLSRELMGSELFGHERGSFTGAIASRDGAIALARRGTLFLDEIGELDLPLQAQLLRVIQERSFKRVGSGVWQQADFRLVCATNRDLQQDVRDGRFRADLYYRISGRAVRLPPLRERRDDIMALAEHFWTASQPPGGPPEFDPALRAYLLARDYPGNVRDLRRLIVAMRGLCAGNGVVTVGALPESERPAAGLVEPERWEPLSAISGDPWHDAGFVAAIKAAIADGAGLKDIGRAASEAAIRIALDQEDGNLLRAARRLRVTDRALQMRKANGRGGEGGR
jgi:transcriptional regulator with GAF, ATPase, and Fis domain